MSLFDRVRDTTTGTGTGNLTLANSAPTGFRTFGSVLSNNDRVYYCIAHQSANEWETGFGTYSTTGPALVRTTILASSNGGAAVNFSSGTKDVFITPPASVFGNRLPEISITSAATATIDRMHVCSGTSADYTVTLPAAANNAGRRLWLRMAPLASLNKLITLDAGAGSTIDGRSTTLSGAINSSVTSITVASATGFPARGNYVIQIASEQMLVTGGQGTTTWTVTRGFNGTVAASQSNGASVDWNRTRVMWAGETAELLCDGSNWFKAGGITIPMVAKMGISGAINIPNATLTKIQLDTTLIDNTQRIADPTTNKRIDIVRGGIYQTSSAIIADSYTNSGQITVSVNGTSVLDFSGPMWNYGEIHIPTQHFVLATGSYIEMYFYQASGVNRSVYSGTTSFGVCEVPTW